MFFQQNCPDTFVRLIVLGHDLDEEGMKELFVESPDNKGYPETDLRSVRVCESTLPLTYFHIVDSIGSALRWTIAMTHAAASR